MKISLALFLFAGLLVVVLAKKSGQEGEGQGEMSEGQEMGGEERPMKKKKQKLRPQPEEEEEEGEEPEGGEAEMDSKPMKPIKKLKNKNKSQYPEGGQGGYGGYGGGGQTPPVGCPKPSKKITEEQCIAISRAICDATCSRKMASPPPPTIPPIPVPTSTNSPKIGAYGAY